MKNCPEFHQDPEGYTGLCAALMESLTCWIKYVPNECPYAMHYAVFIDDMDGDIHYSLQDAQDAIDHAFRHDAKKVVIERK